MEKIIKVIAFSLITIVSACAATPPSHVKKQVQESMKKFVNSQTSEDGIMPVLFEGKVLKLKVKTSEKYADGFHTGVKSHDDLYASCADFVDPETKDKYDIDFIVKKVGESYKVVQPIVHSKNGLKHKYDLHR
jgi:hypothetical protein